MEIIGIIPARYASSRLPGKPLADIGGQSMIWRVYQRAIQAKHLTQVWVATDHEQVYQHLEKQDAKVIMTSQKHETGTERCAEVLQILQKKGINIKGIVNIQGDEPFIDPLLIDQVAALLGASNAQIITLTSPVKDAEELFDHNRPKVVCALDGKALYFSRQPIPYLRGLPNEEWLANHAYQKHIGIYGYHAETLQKIVQLKPTPLEQAEKLEQLRWLENGFVIQTDIVQADIGIAIDTPEDLERARKMIQN